MPHLEKRGGTEARDGEGDAERSDSYGRREAARGARRERMTAAEGSSTRLLSFGTWRVLCVVSAVLCATQRGAQSIPAGWHAAYEEMCIIN